MDFHLASSVNNMCHGHQHRLQWQCRPQTPTKPPGAVRHPYDSRWQHGPWTSAWPSMVTQPPTAAGSQTQ